MMKTMKTHSHSNATQPANGHKAGGAAWCALGVPGAGTDGRMITMPIPGCRRADVDDTPANLGGTPAGDVTNVLKLTDTTFTAIRANNPDKESRARQLRAIRYGAHPRWMHASPPVHGDSMDGEGPATRVRCRMMRDKRAATAGLSLSKMHREVMRTCGAQGSLTRSTACAYLKTAHASAPSAQVGAGCGEGRIAQVRQMNRNGNEGQGLPPVGLGLPDAYKHGRSERERTTSQHAAVKDLISPLANCDSRQYEGAYDSGKERGLLQAVVSGTHSGNRQRKLDRPCYLMSPEVKDIDVPTRGSLPESITVTGSVHQYGLMYAEALMSPLPSYGRTREVAHQSKTGKTRHINKENTNVYD